MINYYKKEYLPVLLFKIYIYFSFIGVGAILFGIPFLNSELFGDITNNLVLPVLLFVHAGHVMGYLRGLVFITLSSLSGFLFEISGLRYGALFNNPYVYNKGGLLIQGVPFNVVLYWGVFIYIGYSITNLLLSKFKNTPSNIFKKVMMDGIVVTSIDLLIDPIGVMAGNWVWLNGGFYFGVPFGNFVSWFFIVTIVTSIFRIYEYYKPNKIDIKKISVSIKVVPIKVYIVLFLIYCIYAFLLGLYKLLLVGTVPMLTIIVLFYYQNRVKNRG